MTNSLDRSGRGGMSAPFKLVDGLVSGPGLAFNSELSSGLYRAGANDIRLAVAGADAFGAAANQLTAYKPLVLSQGANITGDLNAASGSVFRRNAIINGDMRVAQRGTAFANLGAGASQYLVDRWQYVCSAGTTAVIGASQITPGPPQVGNGPVFQYALQLQTTTAQAAIAAGQLFSLRTKIEGYDWTYFAQRNLTLSFWFASSVAGTYSVALLNNGSDRSFVQSFNCPTANTWQFVQMKIPPSPAAGTWNYTNGVGVLLSFALACGTTFQTSTLGSWQTGQFWAATGQANALATAGNNFQLTGVQLEVNQSGSATDFEFVSFADALARCRRYYWKSFPYTTAPAQNVGSAAGALAYSVTNAGVSTKLVEATSGVVMRTLPTVIFYNPSAANANWRNTILNADSGAASVGVAQDRNLIAANPQVAGDAAGHLLYVHATADAEL